LERKDVIARVKDKISAFIETFVEGMGGSVWFSMYNIKTLFTFKQSMNWKAFKNRTY
jgi:hypothetical protein